MIYVVWTLVSNILGCNEKKIFSRTITRNVIVIDMNCVYEIEIQSCMHMEP
jgi:hypothetical protein